MNLKAIIIDDEKHSHETLNNLLIKFCEDKKKLAIRENGNLGKGNISIILPNLG